MSSDGRTSQEKAPDPRVSFADERTFLAWSRTGLALIGGGLAIVGWTRGGVGLLAALPLMAFGAVLAFGSYRRWRRNEQALRRGDPLPDSKLPRELAYGVVVVAAAAAAVVLVRWH